MGRLARDNIGYIDWSPYISKVNLSLTPSELDTCWPFMLLVLVFNTGFKKAFYEQKDKNIQEWSNS